MIIGIILGLIILWVILIYNALISARQRTREAWSTVETQLKRRYDLIPNLVETVKGYAAHESKTLEAVIAARNLAIHNQDLSPQKEQTENMLTGALKSIFALSENYPNLKADASFVELQRELSDTETKIQAARQFYNTAVLSYNTRIQVFPNNLLVRFFHFEPERFFELEENERAAVSAAPRVQF